MFVNSLVPTKHVRPTREKNVDNSWVHHDQLLPVINHLHRGTCNAFRRTRYHVVTNYGERKTILPVIVGQARNEANGRMESQTDAESKSPVRAHKSAPYNMVSFDALDAMFNKSATAPEHGTEQLIEEVPTIVASIETLAHFAENDFIDRNDLLSEEPAVAENITRYEHSSEQKKHHSKRRHASTHGLLDRHHSSNTPPPRSHSSMDTEVQQRKRVAKRERSNSRTQKTVGSNIPNLNLNSKNMEQSEVNVELFCGWETVPQTPGEFINVTKDDE